MPTMHLVAMIVTIAYGGVSIGLGATGYFKAGSVASLVAGGVAGILLVLSGVATPRWPTTSLIVAIIIAALLVVRFIMAWMRKSDTMTDLARATAIVMIGGGVLLVICALAALLTEAQAPGNP